MRLAKNGNCLQTVLFFVWRLGVAGHAPRDVVVLGFVGVAVAEVVFWGLAVLGRWALVGQLGSLGFWPAAVPWVSRRLAPGACCGVVVSAAFLEKF